MSRELIVAQWLAHRDGPPSWDAMPEHLRVIYHQQAAALLDLLGAWMLPE